MAFVPFVLFVVRQSFSPGRTRYRKGRTSADFAKSSAQNDFLFRVLTMFYSFCVFVPIVAIPGNDPATESCKRLPRTKHLVGFGAVLPISAVRSSGACLFPKPSADNSPLSTLVHHSSFIIPHSPLFTLHCRHEIRPPSTGRRSRSSPGIPGLLPARCRECRSPPPRPPSR